MTRVQILFNAAGGRCSPQRVARVADALRARGAAVTLTETGHAPPEIAEVDHVCVIGGDGTLRYVAHALAQLDRPPPLSAYPGGTVNLLAREWDGGACADAFATRVLAQQRRPHFPIEMDGRGLFLACAGVGCESAAVAGVSLPLKRRLGRVAYAWSALRLLARWRPPAIRLMLDGRVLTCGGFHVAKATYYAGPWRLASRALGPEPLMEVVLLTRARRRDLIRFWWTLARGRPVARLPNVEVVACRELHAEADAPWPVQADGDLVGTLPLTLRVAAVPLYFC